MENLPTAKKSSKVKVLAYLNKKLSRNNFQRMGDCFVYRDLLECVFVYVGEDTMDYYISGEGVISTKGSIPIHPIIDESCEECLDQKYLQPILHLF